MRDVSIQVKGDESDGYRNTVIISNNIVKMGILLMPCSIMPPWDYQVPSSPFFFERIIDAVGMESLSCGSGVSREWKTKVVMGQVMTRSGTWQAGKLETIVKCSIFAATPEM